MKERKLSWKQAGDYCFKLANLVKESGYAPNVIVGIARGGLVPTAVMGQVLDNKDIRTVSVKYYEKKGVHSKKPKFVGKKLDLPNHLKILIVDDISDTGHTLDFVRKSLNGRTKTATLHYKPKSIVKPDYFIEETDDWVVYPWEVDE